MIFTVAGTEEESLASTITQKLPEQLHDMIRAGLSNAIYRVAKDDMLPARGFGCDPESENKIDGLVNIFMDELAKPAPEVERFIRHNRLRKTICMIGGPDRIELLRDDYGPWITIMLAQRIFEQEVYDFGRSIGLTSEQAARHVMKARECCSEYNVDLPEPGDYESRECEDILVCLDTFPEPKVLPSIIESLGLEHASRIETGDMEQLLAGMNAKGVKQVKRYLRALKNSGSRSEYEKFILRLRFLDEGPFIDNDGSLRESVASVEAVEKTEEEKVARKDTKKARIKANRLANMRKGQEETNDHQAGNLQEPETSTSRPEQPSDAFKVLSIDDQEKPMIQEKTRNKLKNEPELPVHSKVPSEEHHRHKKRGVDKDAQDAGSKKAKRNKGNGSQRSPFFQQSNGPKAKKKDAVKKAEQLMDFQPPMIQ